MTQRFSFPSFELRKIKYLCHELLKKVGYFHKKLYNFNRNIFKRYAIISLHKRENFQRSFSQRAFSYCTSVLLTLTRMTFLTKKSYKFFSIILLSPQSNNVLPYNDIVDILLYRRDFSERMRVHSLLYF